MPYERHDPGKFEYLIRFLSNDIGGIPGTHCLLGICYSKVFFILFSSSQ